MSLIIVGDTEQRLRAALATVRGPVRLLTLADGETAARARAFVLGRGDVEELPRGELTCARREAFRRRYIEFVAALNDAQRSRFWWALPVTIKNPRSSRLSSDIFEAILVTDLAAAAAGPLVVITESADLVAQLRAWSADGVHGRAGGGQSWWRRLALRLPVLFALDALSTIHTWWISRRLRPSAKGPQVVITTLVHASSFDGTGGFRDAYFGPLAERLAARGVAGMVAAVVVQGPGERLARRLAGVRAAWPVVPVEAFLSVGGLLRCLGHALACWVRPFTVRGPLEFEGRDVRVLVEGALRADCRAGALLTALRTFYGMGALARTLDVDRCIYPYENRGFERMLITALREERPAARLVGYNHASITLSHTNFVLGTGEAKIMPLPDAILSLGATVKDWLEAHGNYPPGMLSVACALRQSAVPSAIARRRRPARELLLALATSFSEYVRTLVLVERAMAAAPGCRLRIRPHPTIPLDAALRAAALRSREFFTVDSGPLEASLASADAVLYASSTVGLEAIARGVPAIYVDLENVFDTDPALGWRDFRWSMRRPEDLAAALAEIDALDDAAYTERQRAGVTWAARYFEPISERGLARFLAA